MLVLIHTHPFRKISSIHERVNSKEMNRYIEKKEIISTLIAFSSSTI